MYKKIAAWLSNQDGKAPVQYLLLAGILLLAAALRFYKLGAWSFWIDEIRTLNHAISHFTTAQLILENIPPNRNWLPVSVIATAQVLGKLGITEWSARLSAAVIGTITAPILYFPAKKMIGQRPALIMVLLLAVSPWHVEWSQNARGYTALLLFYSLAMFSFYFGLEKDRPINFIFFYLFLYLAASERLLALLLVPVLVCYLLALKFLPVEKPAGLRARNMYILLSPFILFVVVQAFGWITTGGSMIGSILDEILVTFVGNPIENPVTQATFIAFDLGIPLLVVALISGMDAGLKRNRAGILFLLGAVIPYVLIVIATIFMFTEERYVFVSLTCWLLLAALGVDRLLKMPGKFEVLFSFGILLVLVADSAGSDLLYFRINNGNRRDWRAAFGIVEENLQEGDLIVSTWPELGNYYLERDVLWWQDLSREAILAGNERVWFVVIPSMTWYTGTQDFYWWVSHNTRMITSFYLRTIDNANLEIYLFDPQSAPTLQPLE